MLKGERITNIEQARLSSILIIHDKGQEMMNDEVGGNNEY